MKIGALVPWMGAKRKLASVIVRELGPHQSYWELFCGSLAVLLAKQPCAQETVCDLHGDLTNLAWVLADGARACELHERLARTLFSEAIFERARGILKGGTAEEAPDLERAYWYFVFSWMGTNGLAGTRDALNVPLALRFTPGGGSPAVRFRSATQSLPAWHVRLGNVVILRRDAFGVLDDIADVPGTALYIDSPYLFPTRTGGSQGVPNARYLHDFDQPPEGLFASESDPHERLADKLRRFKQARVVVSYYRHARLQDLYRGWTFRDCATAKNLAASRRRGRTGAVKAPEILILNGPSYAEEAP